MCQHFTRSFQSAVSTHWTQSPIFFCYTQGNQQPFTDFLNLQKLALEADLLKLDVGDIQCFCAIVGAADHKLCQCLLNLSPLTLASIQQEACEYEMLKIVSKSLDNPPERAVQLKSGPKHPKNYQNQSRHNQSYRQAMLQQFCGRCLHCGSSKHTWNCPKTNLQCHRCNRAGHTGYVCLNPQPKTGLQHLSHQQSRQPSPIHSLNHSQSAEHQHRASVLTVVKNTTSGNEALCRVANKLWAMRAQHLLWRPRLNYSVANYCQFVHPTSCGW